jgi:hypothetical protein
MPFPQITTCLVCEVVRQEMLGKYALLGFFGVAPQIRIALRDFRLPYTVSFFFIGGSGSGTYHVELRVRGPSGQLVQGESVPLDGALDPSIPVSNFILFFNGLLPGPGQYRISLVANQAETYATNINFDQGLGVNWHALA